MALCCIKISDYGFEMADRSEGSNYHLAKQITFEYSNVCRSLMVISEDKLSTRKRNFDSNLFDGVGYGKKPLKGVSELEVEMVHCGNKWSTSIMFGQGDED